MLIAASCPRSFIDKLWNDPNNKALVDKFWNNKLCREAAKGHPEALKAFGNYAIQDYFYLIDYVKFKALRLVSVPNPVPNIPASDKDPRPALDTETSSVGRSYGYAVDWLKKCRDGLGIPVATVAQTERSIAELAYGNFLQSNALTDDWFNAHIIVIACVYGWSKLALELYNDPSTVKDTPFYKYWIMENIQFDEAKKPVLADSAVALANFLAKNESLFSSQNDRDQYQTLFRTNLRLEIAFFDSAYD
ncbi:heme oxygenase-like protein [Trametes elegans]|nr:heme oxygenase-like protein [Trametes elegans]